VGGGSYQEKGRLGVCREGEDCQGLARGLNNIWFHSFTEYVSFPRVMYVQS